MMPLILPLLFMPFCATMAGLSVWAGSRHETLDDSDLLRRFLILLAAWMLLTWGTSRIDGVRLLIDPAFRIQTELNAHPVYSTIARLSPDDLARLQGLLAQQLAGGATVPEAFLQARPLLTRMTNHLLGFADQKTRIRWGHVTVETLAELRSHDPRDCYRAMSQQPLSPQTLSQAFTAENTASFQRAVAALYTSAYQGMGYDRPPGDQPPDRTETWREYRAIQDTIAQRFGKHVAEQLAKRSFTDPPATTAAEMCSARIIQLEAILQRPQAMAAAMIDSVLR